MNRRSFLKFLGGAAAAAVVPSATKYFFAPAGGWEWDGSLYTRYGVQARNGPILDVGPINIESLSLAFNQMAQPDLILFHPDLYDAWITFPKAGIYPVEWSEPKWSDNPLCAGKDALVL